MVVRPIGEVRNEIDKSIGEGLEEAVSEIVLQPHLEEALEGL